MLLADGEQEAAGVGFAGVDVIVGDAEVACSGIVVAGVGMEVKAPCCEDRKVDTKTSYMYNCTYEDRGGYQRVLVGGS
jgi:hypothetical protein